MPTKQPEGSSLKLARAYMAGMEARGELVKGTTDRLIGLFADKGSPAQTLRLAAEFLEGEGAARYRNPEHRPASAESPLRAVINRLAAGGIIKPESAAALVDDWSIDAGAMTAGRLAERLVAQRLQQPANHRHLVAPPPMPEGEAKARRILEAFRSGGQLSLHIQGERMARVALDMARQFGGQAEHKMAASIANMIKQTVGLQPEGGVRFDPRDGIFQSPGDAVDAPPAPGAKAPAGGAATVPGL